jgi:hypothetical protein
MTITKLSRLSDAELVAAVSRCSRDENGATAQLVAHLAEFDVRRQHLAAGYSSLVVYSRVVLGLSVGGRDNRIEAARAARRFPVILGRLAEGTLNVTTVRMVAKRLTPENHLELLKAVARRSKSEVEEILARRFPEPDTPSSVRKVPERTAPGPISVAPPLPPLAARTEEVPPPPISSPFVASAPPKPVVRPLAPERYEIRFTASAETRDTLKVALVLLRHAVPSGDPAEIFDRALSALIENLSRRKMAIVRKPKAKPRPTAAGSRHIPSEVKRAVWSRDGGRCAFVGAEGHRCRERAFPEYHHVKPYAADGEATVANIELRCRAHNGYESDVFDGTGRAHGAGIVGEPGENYAVSWGFGLVPERVGSTRSSREVR